MGSTRWLNRIEPARTDLLYACRVCTAQVVNADVGELWDMPLKGRAAVGMTPFCNKDANGDTTGFRFFAQGYWKDHLNGRPYHISALFVVDLHKFRRRGYGDQYRIFYDNLSKDPNSLANLDQDLPNY